MIESGSHVVGVSPDAFGLPAGTALRCERPAPALTAMFPSYAVLDSDPEVRQGAGSWILPSAAQIWIGLEAGPISVQVRNRRYAALGSAMLFGPTSSAMPVMSRGGVTVVLDVSPVGWARLFATSAADVRDRIEPLDAHLSRPWGDMLIERLHACDRGGDVKSVLDRFFAEHLPGPTGSEALVGRVAQALFESETDVARLPAELGIGDRALLRLCNRYFGFGPKLLQRRIRFLRAFTAMLATNEQVDFSAVPPGYHDVPHFLRDAAQFLGMTPRQFIAMPILYLRAVLRARMLVANAPVSSLDRIPA